MGKTRNPFRGLMDHMSEMTRMREYAEGAAERKTSAGPTRPPGSRRPTYSPKEKIW